MPHQVIGWESTDPVPNHVFNSYLSSRHGQLYYDDLNLARLVTAADHAPAPYPSPLELIYLPMIRRKIHDMQDIFARAIADVGYGGRFHYAYASKANTAEEVVRTTLEAGAHHEMSSVVDVEIVQIMRRAGLLRPECMVFANGFKPAGSAYADSLLRLKRTHDNLIPIVESLDELPPLLHADEHFELGLRQKSYGFHPTLADMDASSTRFGMDTEQLWQAAAQIDAAPHLQLTVYHAMIGSQITDVDRFIAGLEPAIEQYARLRQQYPSLSIFNFGGGMPVAMTLDFAFDYDAFVHRLLQTFQRVCGQHNVPVPDVMGEFGRYTTSEHGAHFFKVITVKEAGYQYPWYIVDGSIMTSFPDSWALSEHFIVLPLNHLDKPFRRVRLGGVTCDSDDVYPPKPSQAPLYLPVETDELFLGFFSVGAYQEMLGGVRGSKHCVLPEAAELIVDRDTDGDYSFYRLPGQSTEDVLRNLGYV